jgi:hypothetical protein
MTRDSLLALCNGYDKKAYADFPSVCYSDPCYENRPPASLKKAKVE